MSERWRGIMDGSVSMYTHPWWLSGRLARFAWRNLCCRWDWHLWDEVLSGVNERHYLTCDACDAEFVGHGREEES